VSWAIDCFNLSSPDSAGGCAAPELIAGAGWSWFGGIIWGWSAIGWGGTIPGDMKTIPCCGTNPGGGITIPIWGPKLIGGGGGGHCGGWYMGPGKNNAG
jgi:hypothetical protein